MLKFIDTIKASNQKLRKLNKEIAPQCAEMVLKINDAKSSVVFTKYLIQLSDLNTTFLKFILKFKEYQMKRYANVDETMEKLVKKVAEVIDVLYERIEMLKVEIEDELPLLFNIFCVGVVH